MSTPRQMPLSLAHRPSLSAENYLVAEPNRNAWRWLERWPDWPAPGLAIHGPAGCGKTHLVHVFLCRCKGALLSAATLAREPSIDLAARAQVAIVDDADRAVAAGLAAPLLHLYNALAERGRFLLLTGEEPPARWPIALPDLRSRLTAIPAVGIGAPDDEVMAAVLVKLFADRQLKVDDEVIRFALSHIERSFEAARRLVAAADNAALASRRKVSVPLLRELLKSNAGEAA